MCQVCYETFKDQLNPILRRPHSGNASHSGKIPARIGGTIHLRRNIEDLKNLIKEMISKEEFERAAELRDEIRKLEKQLNADQKGGE